METVPGRHRPARTHALALVIGGTAGALMRHAVAITWPWPTQLSVTAALAFAVAGFIVAGGVSWRCAALCEILPSAATLSAWSY